jgi:CubicO group peptidase (beta-lactamase class C family)
MLNFALLLLSLLSVTYAGTLPVVDEILEKALDAKTLPGGVLFVGQKDTVIEKSAVGTTDGTTKVTFNTIYDLASLTKVVATATSIMILEEQGKLKVTDKLSQYYYPFRTPSKKNITIEDLMRHRSGLPASVKILPTDTYEDFIARSLALALQYKPGTDVVYSDVGFIILGDLVQKISGTSLHQFTHDHIYKPLGMNHTGYFVEEKEECAPTTKKAKCVPHDPKAFVMYPHNLGHAGVFSTIDDLSRFAKMYLQEGILDGVRILETATVKRMTEITDPELRGLGWDLLSPYASAPRGEVFEKGTSYGHTGYTGTTIWIDPKTKSFYVFLSNRVYLGEDNTAKPFTALRRELSTEIGRFIYSTSSTPETLQ